LVVPLPFPSREPGGPPPRQSISILLSVRIHVCFPGSAHTPHAQARASRGGGNRLQQQCHDLCRRARAVSQAAPRKGARKEGSTERRQDGRRHQKLAASASVSASAACSVPLQACMHDASALCRHMGWVLISKPKRSLESISLAFYCSSAPVQTAGSSRPYLLVHTCLDLCTGEILEVYLLKTLNIYTFAQAPPPSPPPPKKKYTSATHLSLTNWDIPYTDFHMTAHTSSSLEYTSVFPKII
jgi:hypothetical protein